MRLFLAAASSWWQMTRFFLSFTNVAVLCKSSDLVFQLCNTNNHNLWWTSCIPPPLRCFLNLSVFGVWFHVCIVTSEHLSQLLYRLPFSRTENAALVITNLTVNIFIRQFEITFWLLFMVINDASVQSWIQFLHPVQFLLDVMKVWICFLHRKSRCN